MSLSCKTFYDVCVCLPYLCLLICRKLNLCFSHSLNTYLHIKHKCNVSWDTQTYDLDHHQLLIELSVIHLLSTNLIFLPKNLDVKFFVKRLSTYVLHNACLYPSSKNLSDKWTDINDSCRGHTVCNSPRIHHLTSSLGTKVFSMWNHLFCR